MDGIIITVNYKNSKTTIQFIDNLIKLNNFEKIDLFVVDNGSDNQTVEHIKSYLQRISHPNIYLITISKNIGYFGAVNYVIKNNVENIENYKFCIVCNNDIKIKDNDFFNKLILYSYKNDLIAPRIISLVSGKDQNPHRESEITNFQKIQYKLLFSNYYIGLILYILRSSCRNIIRFFIKKTINLSERDIFAMHGSFMIFSDKYFMKGGYIDDGYFLYGEEDSVSAICQMIKAKITFIPELVVYHDEHKTSNSQGFKKRIYLFQKEAYIYIKNKYKILIYEL